MKNQLNTYKTINTIPKTITNKDFINLKYKPPSKNKFGVGKNFMPELLAKKIVDDVFK